MKPNFKIDSIGYQSSAHNSTAEFLPILKLLLAALGVEDASSNMQSPSSNKGLNKTVAHGPEHQQSPSKKHRPL